MPRRQPPVRSPLPLGAWTRAALRAGGRAGDADPRRRLRARLLERFQADGALLTDSGTTALRLAIRGVAGPEGTVALPAFTCYDVATAAVGAGARVVLYDLDPATLGPEPASFEAALRAGARAAVVAPLYGVPVDWARIGALAERHGARLIEDAAQGHGARYRGAPLGALGDVSVLSFGRGKGWTGSGGGALLWRRGAAPPASDAAGGGVVRGLRAGVLGLAQAALGRPSLYWLPASVPGTGLGETRYRPPGSVRGMTPFQAALVLATEGAADAEAAVRRAGGAGFRAALAESDALVPDAPADATPGYLRFPILVDGGLEGLGDVAAALRLGIAPAYPTALDRLPAVRERLGQPAETWPGAARLAAQLVTLPTHGLVSPAEREAIARRFAGRRNPAAVPVAR